jgi:FtsP/CotA-like multicopper oxidase with cupredoxin domain
MKWFLALLLISSQVLAKTYDLEVTKSGTKLFINHSIPGPTLVFKEGDDAEIRVKNSTDETTSIHWHGLLLPGNMDGVPGLNGFHGINPNETFTYKFKIRQAGTYWYHSHSNFQEQQGMYGALIINPKKEIQQFDREYVLVLSDATKEDPKTILNNLKIDSGYYNYNKRTIFTFFADVKKDGFFDTLSDYLHWGEMRMDPTDLSDVTNYDFLINGQKNWSAIFKKGEKVKLRFINAAAMTIYDVSIPGLKMKFIEADGQPIKPILADEFRIGVAETYDVIIEPKDNKTYTIFAESLDRTGYATAILFSKKERVGKIPQMRPRSQLTMADMHEGMGESGWSNRGTPEGNKALEYSDLVAFMPQKDLREPMREIEFRFGGSMNRYIWTINGEKFPKPVLLKFGERVRLKFINETMMAHPIHLHGMFMQLENGQKMQSMPNKHTVIIPPAQTVSLFLTADEEGDWAFHCHLLYHMASGMMTSVTVKK